MVMRTPGRLVASLATFVLFSAACSSNTAPTTHRVLIVDKAFDLKTADPHRELDVTGALVAKSLYSTLLTFDGADESTPAPSVASSYFASEDATRFTFKLRRDVLFSDGTPLTSADVIFSFNRLINLKSRPSSLLAGVTASASDAATIVLSSNAPNPTIPFILTNPALGIVNSTLVKSHGGTAVLGADKSDKAEEFLNVTSAGSGPYVLKSFSTFSDVELVANPRYWGPKPFFPRIVIRNMSATTQLAYIASESDEVALDLSPAQAGTLSANPSVRVQAASSPDVVFLFANENPDVSTVTSNKHFQKAVRYALDYGPMVRLMGAGAIQAAGVVPAGLLGALPGWAAPAMDLDNAKAELAASGLNNPTVNLGFASDKTVSGLPISALASMVRAALAKAGIKVNLTGSPTSAASADYAAGSQQMGLWAVTAISADPNSFLTFLPGQDLGLRAGWTAGADPSLESLGIQASTAADTSVRAQLFQMIQGQLNAEGPFFPLVQPGRVIVAAKGIAAIDFNPTWSTDLAAVRAA